MKKNEQSFHIQLYGTSPAPKRDYHGLTITSHQVTLNTWHITHSPYVFPKVYRCSIPDYPSEFGLHPDIISVFGDHLHEYLIQLATDEPSLVCIPNKLMLRILKFLSAQDILRLSQTSKIFWELCNTNPVWKIIFNKCHKYPATSDECKRGETIGWKQILQTRLCGISYALRLRNKNENRPFNITRQTCTVETNKYVQPNLKNSVSLLVPVQTVTPKKTKQKSRKNKSDDVFNKNQINSKYFQQSKSANDLIDKEKLFNTSLLSKSAVLLKKSNREYRNTQKHVVSKFTK